MTHSRSSRSGRFSARGEQQAQGARRDRRQALLHVFASTGRGSTTLVVVLDTFKQLLHHRRRGGLGFPISRVRKEGAADGYP